MSLTIKLCFIGDSKIWRFLHGLCMYVCAYMRVCACMHACCFACVLVCVCLSVCVCGGVVCIFLILLYIILFCFLLYILSRRRGRLKVTKLWLDAHEHNWLLILGLRSERQMKVKAVRYDILLMKKDWRYEMTASWSKSLWSPGWESMFVNVCICAYIVYFIILCPRDVHTFSHTEKQRQTHTHIHTHTHLSACAHTQTHTHKLRWHLAS